ncbi:hypothetical protein K435DRAFT_843269 [Dendrothele bispora CBS 962.96]|uniref:Uncharacterized protein n=1 Tax=Dendrothele bispora (strain CBS 962.96) TaxID=1314807 RepID=A0A4S8LAY6_DENBC|nr:hypothetical protein K435DRAFT_843269 [Dendrothele bispora CBS 962.96]
MDHWSFSVLRAQGLQRLHKDKSWRPIVCVSVDGSAGQENHCPMFETVLGIDGQNPNQKETYWLRNPPKPSSSFLIEVFYRSPSKKKAKKRVLVASASYSIGGLVARQAQEPKPQLRLTTRSPSFTKSKSQKPSAVAKRSPTPSLQSSSKANPAHRLSHATIQVKLTPPSDYKQDREWRRFLSTQTQSSIDTQLTMSDNFEADESEHGVLGDVDDFVISPTSSKASHWPSSPLTSQHHQHEFPLLPNEQNETAPSQPDTGLRRRRRRRRPVLQGYAIDSDCNDERWVSESCTCTDSETEQNVGEGYHSPTPSHHVDDDDDDDDADSQPQSHSNQGGRWYTEIIRVTRVTRIIEFLPMMDPGILPTYRNRDGVVDSPKVPSDIERSDTDSSSAYSNETEPELDPRERASGSKLSLNSESGTLVGTPPPSVINKGSSPAARPSIFGKFDGMPLRRDLLKGGLGRKARKGKEGKKKDKNDLGTTGRWWERLLCAFTMYAEMKKAGELCGLNKPENNSSGDVESSSSDPERGLDRWARDKAEDAEADRMEEGRNQFEQVFKRLQMEWTYIGGLLVALAAVNTAVFAIGSDAIIQVNKYAISFVAASSVFTGLGIVCNAWFFLRYAWCDLDTFLVRSRDIYSTHIFFSISARIPALCLFLSSLTLLGFLALTAYAAWPTGVIVVCFLVGVVMGLQFVVRGVEVVGRLIGKGVRWIGKGAMKAVAVPVGFFMKSGDGSTANGTVTPNGTSGSGSQSQRTSAKPDNTTHGTSATRDVQKVTEPAVGPGNEKWRARFKKEKSKKKSKAEAEAREGQR